VARVVVVNTNHFRVIRQSVKKTDPLKVIVKNVPTPCIFSTVSIAKNEQGPRDEVRAGRVRISRHTGTSLLKAGSVSRMAALRLRRIELKHCAHRSRHNWV
jgi:hypothetical protein